MLLIILFFCTKREMIINNRPYFDVRKMIEELEDGFSFEWEMRNRVMNFSGKGEYIGGGKYNIKGSMIVDGKKEEIGDMDPYEMIKVLIGEGEINYKGNIKDYYVYMFKGNLFFLDPLNGEGNGEIFVKDSSIHLIKCEGKGAYFNMKIFKKLSSLTKYFLNYEGDMKKIIERLLAFGERDVVFEGNILKFREIFEIDERIFNEGDVKFMLLKSDYNTSLKDPIDTLFTYKIVDTINLNCKNILKDYDQKGRPVIVLNTEENLEGYIGLFIDGRFVSTGYGKKMIIFPFQEERERDLVYSIMKTGKIDGKIKNFRRLK